MDIIDTYGEKIYSNFFTNFINFLKGTNIIQVGVAFIVATNVNNIINIFINSILNPIINRIFGSEGNDKNQKELKDKTITILGIKFGIGAFISGLIQFLIILYIVYMISKMV